MRCYVAIYLDRFRGRDSPQSVPEHDVGDGRVGVSPVSTNGTDLRLRFKEGWGFVVVTKERR